ncbi:MAG: DUF4886 domain-containing protein [Ruminococcaceae bacterium]|nr:DUF4886 domain-containing protein [Oscillospiraceae bacterium]
MKVLAIGNSFSQNAMTYLHDLAASAGTYMKTVNLYIGGCSLRTHYLNMLEDKPAYDFQFNGQSTGIKVTIKQGLMSDEWDVITLQQASPLSPDYITYQPYLDELAAYVRKYQPQAKLMIHQTWAYEDRSEALMRRMKLERSADMFAGIEKSYAAAAHAIGAAGIIPCGKAMLRAVENGIANVHSDSCHANDIGKYLQALVWYGYLTGKSAAEVAYKPNSEAVTEEDMAIARRTAAEVLCQY